MKRMSLKLMGVASCVWMGWLAAGSAAAAEADASKYPRATKQDMQWWEDAKFGVFMHWGPSSIAGQSISWSRHGPRPGHSSKHATRGVPLEVYDNLYRKFNPVKFDADAWAKMVEDAGAKYLVFTVKHHDGFSMFDSKYTDYDIMSTPFGRDICKELADAFHKRGIRLMWYFSQPDWHHPDYETDRHDKFIEFLHNQLGELCTNYGRVDGIWWDGLGRPPETWDALGLLKKIRKWQPHAITNHRFVGRHRMTEFGDFDTAENHIGHFQLDRPWESCIKLGGPWSWGGYDRSSMSAHEATRTLIHCVGRGGNLLMNTGPSPLGEIHAGDYKVYLEIGKWLKRYGESIYATRGGPYKPGAWGVSTRKGDKIYLHVMQLWPDGELVLPSPGAKVVSAKALTGGEPKVTRDGKTVRIALDGKHHDALDTIIELTLDRDAMGLAVVETESGRSLTVGKRASASSENGEKRVASAAIAADIKVFEEGAYTKSGWQPSGKDKSPWWMVDLGEAMTFDQVSIKERGGAIEAFRLEYREGENWRTFHRGKELGDFSLRVRPVKAQQVRLVIERVGKGLPTINEFNLYSTQ